jgi:Na+-transporting methylmalonyl-CoA/oxaloacetate decarboxylase beta subunit
MPEEIKALVLIICITIAVLIAGTAHSYLALLPLLIIAIVAILPTRNETRKKHD